MSEETLAEVDRILRSGDYDADFRDWCKRVTPAFQWDWAYLRLIQKELGRITRGENDRLMILCPPRHGKSAQVTVRYPPFRIDRDPATRVIVGCYSADLAYKFSRQTRRILQNQGVRLTTDRVDDWETTEEGGGRYVGVGGGVTGLGGNLILIDDPIKSRMEANSRAYRERVWHWYLDDILTRLEPDGALILIMTHWHHDDIAGRIMASEEAKDWTIVILPALAEDDDPLGRREGEALCPERYDEAALHRLKRLLADSFLALYQQRPTLETGEIIKREWFRYYRAAPAKFKLKIHSWDTAYKPAQINDPSVRTTWGETHEGYYLTDVWRERVEYPALKRQVIRDAERDQPQAVLIEDKASGQSLIQELRRYTRIPVVAINPEGDKLIRASTASIHYESGQVFHPERASWLSEYEAELLQFPAGSTDDQVDSMSQALTWLAKRLRHGGVASAGKREFA